MESVKTINFREQISMIVNDFRSLYKLIFKDFGFLLLNESQIHSKETLSFLGSHLHLLMEAMDIHFLRFRLRLFMYRSILEIAA